MLELKSNKTLITIMRFEDLNFKEIDDKIYQAVVDLGNGYRIQIIFDERDEISECNLYTPQGLVLDESDNEDKRGVELFIKQAQFLMDDIKFWNDARDCEIVPKQELLNKRVL